MSKCRIVYKADGSIAVIYPAIKTKKTYKEIMDKSTIANNFVGLDYDDIDTGDLPQTRKYRNAWRGSKGQPIMIDQTVKAEIDAQPTPEQSKVIMAELFKDKFNELKAEGKL